MQEIEYSDLQAILYERLSGWLPDLKGVYLTQPSVIYYSIGFNNTGSIMLIKLNIE